MSTSETAPAAQEWVVKIIDQSGATEDNIIEQVKGFLDLAHANAFARAYVRDSIERCRVPGASSREVLESWFSFGENAEVIDAGDDGWKANSELDDFVSSPATPMERDWRSLDPRRLVEEDGVFFDDKTINDHNDEDDSEVSEIIRH
ncbi:hypothetical protein GT348_02590 [Aristophania vespae]|uniref:Uncharacterized protein n=1 Tax=Aristophania vespae TaxID=2697033 RepID=A0A6P1NCY0_9PROT|nr:hypothetical protein [Aristophania vespae]QHI95309.1 hypothetical protein GT348_02590 [Aristophania vespae]UMM64565.1 hypothetical protein DM15PD_15810 [Aristophania vespae]